MGNCNSLPQQERSILIREEERILIETTRQFLETYCDVDDKRHVRCEELDTALYIYLCNAGMKSSFSKCRDEFVRTFARNKFGSMFHEFIASLLFDATSSKIRRTGFIDYCNVYKGIALNSFPVFNLDT
jgi:hypothetical protein